MAKFFDKIGEIAKTAADKTNNVIEQTRINTKINAEETSISKLKEQIGNFYWEKISAGAQPDAEIAGWCDAIKIAQQEIISLRKDLAVLKGDSNTPAASAATGTIKCPACGSENPSGTKFCGACGNKLE